MSDVTMIGLGLMGAALARAMHGAGHDLTVWNRSPARMAPFRADGVSCADDLAAALWASPTVVVCIDDHDAARALLEGPEAAPALRGRVVVQLSSGTPKEAEDAAARMAALGALYLDGAILGGPSGIGTAQAKILLSGDAEAHERAGAMLDCLGDGTVRYLGANARAAAALDLAWLMPWYGAFASVAHAAEICRAEGADLNDLGDLLADDPALAGLVQVVRDRSYDDFTASLRVWGAALHKIRRQGRDAGIGTEVPDFIAGLFDRAVQAGHGDAHAMALTKVLRPEG